MKQMQDMLMTATEESIAMEWLLHNASAPVRRLAHVHLLGESPDAPGMDLLWDKVEDSPLVALLFSLQRENGAWFDGGPWGPRGYKRETGEGFTPTRPKFVTTAWLLPYLGEIGYRATDPRIQNAVTHILSEVPTSDAMDTPPPANACGLSAVTLWALSSVGMAADPLLAPAWRQLLAARREDGGWLHPFHLAETRPHCTTKGRWPWDRSCAWGSHYAARALQASQKDLPETGEAYRAVAGFLLAHLAARPAESACTWAWHGHNLLRELEMFVETGATLSEEPIAGLCRWLRGFYKPERGTFQALPAGKPFPRQIAALATAVEEDHGKGYWAAEAKVSMPILRHMLLQVAEEDWLTYRLVRLSKMIRER